MFKSWRCSIIFSGFMLATLAWAGAVSAGAAEPAQSRRAVEAGIEELLSAQGGASRVETSEATGAARLILLVPDKSAASNADPEMRAAEFFARHGAALGMRDPATELQHLRTVTDLLGTTHVEYRQRYHGLPVFGTRVKAHFDADGRLYVVNGSFIPGVELDPVPRLDAAAAIAIARKDVLRRLGRTTPAATTPRLLVFRENLTRGVPGANRLAWEVEVGDGIEIRELVFVDAHKGDVIDRISLIHDTIDRRVYDGGFNAVSLVWTEGDIVPIGDIDIDHLIDYTEDSYNLFATVTNGTFLSWDGVDGTMHAVNNNPSINCPNANWNGTSTNYCPGVTADDTVAHEWAHAYTQSTHGLIYQWQSGALNESYSDIWGEVVDILNGSGTDSPVPLRGEGQCSIFGGTPPPALKVNSPPSIQDFYAAAGASYNPSSARSVTGVVRSVFDGDDEGGTGSMTDGCQPLTNFTPGSIALIDRGACSFVTKTINAQAAGASAVIVVNNDGDSVFGMSGPPSGITIPSIMIGQSDGDTIKPHLLAGVGATVSTYAATESSYRWLSGEDDPAFGGAIRDMWNPNCFGDAGKVTDPTYWCAEGDNGGVHSNSGIPNHAFALLIDGGAYNGQTIQSIGVTRAARIYWRAQSVYQIRTTGFREHADALELACNDLIGMPLYEPITEEPDPVMSSHTIAEADCDEVAKVMLAVEMRTPPTQCNFIPMLATDAPAVCEGGPRISLSDTDWETGLAGWTPGTRNVENALTFDTPDWAVVTSLPDGRPGSAAFVGNLVIGNCTDDIEAGVLFIESPSISLPDGVAEFGFTFDHWNATELRWDGANVKISVNAGPWSMVPLEAFSYNPYNETINSAFDGNTNPLAGEPAFSGSDGGSVVGGWGQSQVDLSGLAGPGDLVRLRFELGQDGCNGRVGWYVDDVQVSACACEGGAALIEWYADVDGDGFGDSDAIEFDCTQPIGFVASSGDCNDADSGAWSVPGEILSLTYGNDKQTLSWSAPLDPGGVTFASDLLRSEIAANFDAVAVCAESDDESDTTAVDVGIPQPGKTWYYLVRAQNSCQEGPLGVGSDEVDRIGRSCIATNFDFTTGRNRSN